MDWHSLKQFLRRTGVRFSLLNQGSPFETIHAEVPRGPFIQDVHLYAYEPHKWLPKLLQAGIQPPPLCTPQLTLFA
jgi:hypothetical protein